MIQKVHKVDAAMFYVTEEEPEPPEWYAEVSVIVAGVLEETETHTDETTLREFITALEKEAEGHGYPTQVYIIYHRHPPSECGCLETLTDHHPAYSWNTGMEEEAVS